MGISGIKIKVLLEHYQKLGGLMKASAGLPTLKGLKPTCLTYPSVDEIFFHLHLSPHTLFHLHSPTTQSLKFSPVRDVSLFFFFGHSLQPFLPPPAISLLSL